MEATKLFMFQLSSNLATAMSVISGVSIAVIGLLEVIGIHLQYSKFWKSSALLKSSQIKVSSRIGMLLLYTPALIAAVASFWVFPVQDFRFFLVKVALTLHFLKRDFEVLFVHKYSGGMVLDSTILISFSYFIGSTMTIYSQHLSQGLQEPPIDLKYIGIALFVIGLIGNFYHHCLLSQLRTNNTEKDYKIPRHGMFKLVICPHYLFEIMAFVGIAFVSQTMFAFCFTIGTIVYLIGRSYATRKWYVSKFEDFPKNVKALVPFVF